MKWGRCRRRSSSGDRHDRSGAPIGLIPTVATPFDRPDCDDPDHHARRHDDHRRDDQRGRPVAAVRPIAPGPPLAAIVAPPPPPRARVLHDRLEASPRSATARADPSGPTSPCSARPRAPGCRRRPARSRPAAGRRPTTRPGRIDPSSTPAARGHRSAPRPRAVGGRARELDLDADGHGEHGTVAAPPNGAGTVAAVPVYALGDQVPSIDATAYVHPDAVIIGSVTIGPESSVWPGAVLRGDDGEIRIGARTSVQDGCVLHTTPERPDGRRRRVRDRSPRPPGGLHDRGPGAGRQRRWCCTAPSSTPGRSSAPTPSCCTTSTFRRGRSPSARRR